VAALIEGGCDPVLVVVGAAAHQVSSLVRGRAEVVRAADWSDGLGASLRAGLLAAGEVSPEGVAALVTLVDLPGVTAATVARIRARAGTEVLARAVYAGRPSHPVLLGRSHWPGVIRSAAGDRGAGPYLARRSVALIECADIGSGADLDTPEDVADALERRSL
jgi:nicotine blue oxidoreductase